MKTSDLNYKELVSSYGVSRNILNSILVNNFHIEDQYLPALEFYRVVHMSGFKFKLFSNSGLITYTRTKDNPKPECVIIYHNCLRLTAVNADEVRVSFRAAKPEYNLPAYALVEVVKQ